ncbi:MAG TPA: FAD-dependent oxidoreductase [Gemmatimonadaceae bacterium]|nr:FAD-dependent oxidoreductase [Gemmatimonadaceae bacterium]
MTRRHLVLAGAGHAQLDLIAALSRAPLPAWDVTLVTPQADFLYSGLLPAVLAGSVQPAAAAISVSRIALAAGISVHVTSVVGLDVARRALRLGSGDELRYDLLSLDVGSTPAAMTVPGAADHAFAMRPFAAALALNARIAEAIADSRPRSEVAVVVVGAGAAGVEVAFALRARIAHAGRAARVTLVDPAMTDGLPLHGFPPGFRRLARRALFARGIELSPDTVRDVRHDGVRVDGPGRARVIPSAATAWVTGPAAPPWLASSGLACDARGYALADAHLALDDDRTVFGGGDCVTLRDHPDTPKAGVFAVRMAPVLAANVLAAAHGAPPERTYVPQRDFLALLSTGDGAALLRWRGVALEARWAQRLKMRIDESYLRRYRALAT